MPSVQDYLNAQKLAERSIETMKRVVRQAADAAQATTTQGNYDDLERLVNDATRATFTDTLVSQLVSYVQPAIVGLPEEELLAKELILSSFYGVTGAQVAGFVDAAKGDFTFDKFMKWLNSDATQYREAQGRRAQAPLSILDKVSVNDVASYVGLTVSSGTIVTPPGTSSPRVISRPDLVTLNDKAELLAIFEQSGAIPPKYLENKPYVR